MRQSLFILFACLCFATSAQEKLPFFKNDTVFNKQRFLLTTIGGGAVCVGAMVGLNYLWYKDYPRTSFHFFDDNAEWLQMDKVGHVVSAYQVGRLGYHMIKWSGVDEKKALWYGGMYGSVLLITVEILDGFSEQWGFSSGDFIANAAGSFAFVGQQLAWKEQRLSFKYSFSQTEYAQYRPSLLGSNWQENFLKDYNGQTLWLSANLRSFWKDSKIPKWLNVAVGYGAERMLTARGKYLTTPGDGSEVLLVFDPYRQAYLSLDVDLTRIKTKSHFLNSVLSTFAFIKIPFPALELSEGKLKGHWLHF